ncbi:GatB/YqeY domain-containing protein [Luteibaculum oceani]|uniref:GatB/YqeY domain-containing protein n=1 Tax=Luteibaculum oceani TaxID=1294296 RepID=A0A5C6V110_9FLAO|nr:GatB/YqeY domain-containing protein [Luteibaculum oceani]TXC78869.1 GatB/YqeY domain-containing protein [Luteibaculum oceani]
MSLTAQINEDIKTAMKAKEKDKLAALRAIKSALLLEATKDGSGDVDEATGMKILQKLHKQRMEAAEIFKEQNREEQYQEEMLQAEVIEAYLPAKMSAEELETELKTIIKDLGVSQASEMGKVMGVASKKLAGKADGKEISAVVRKLLS